MKQSKIQLKYFVWNPKPTSTSIIKCIINNPKSIPKSNNRLPWGGGRSLRVFGRLPERSCWRSKIWKIPVIHPICLCKSGLSSANECNSFAAMVAPNRNKYYYHFSKIKHKVQTPLPNPDNVYAIFLQIQQNPKPHPSSNLNYSTVRTSKFGSGDKLLHTATVIKLGKCLD